MNHGNIRIINGVGKSTRTVTLPQDIPFKRGDNVIIERIDDKSCKMTKIEIVINKYI